MKYTITLQEYLAFGGKIKKVDWANSSISPGWHGLTGPVLFCSEKRKKGPDGERRFDFTFAGGKLMDTHPFWIHLEVTLFLEQKYL